MSSSGSDVSFVIDQLTLIAYLVLVCCVAGAMVFDLRFRRIPNTVILIGLAGAFAMHALAFQLFGKSLAGTAWWSPLAGLALGFVLMLPLNMLRAMGAGDVKMMAMVGAFVGPGAVATAALYTVLAGGLLSLAFMMGRGVAVQTLANLRFMLTNRVRARSGQAERLEPLQTTAARLPYAVAIALGTAAALLWPLATP